MNRNKISAEEFDRLFDEGQVDITRYLDLKAASRPGRKIKRINVDFPAWMVAALDEEATHLGVSRQALIKFVMNSHLRNSAS